MTIYSLNGVAPDLPEDGNFYIAPDANVIGRVKMLAASSVWFGARSFSRRAQRALVCLFCPSIRPKILL